MQSTDKPSLYARLGSISGITTVVDDFIDRMMSDPRLNANIWVSEAHHRLSPAGFKYLVTEIVCTATGGPQRYNSKSTVEWRTRLKVTSQEWNAFLDDVQQTLNKFAVRAGEQAELKAIIDRTRSEIAVDSVQSAGV